MLRPLQSAEQSAGLPSGHTMAVLSTPPEISCILAFFGWDVASPLTTPPSMNLLAAANDPQVSPSHGLLMCALCQRQIATWNFPSSTMSHQSLGSDNARQHQTRTFDVLREHRTHCPYVVKATLSPFLAPMSVPYVHEGAPDIRDMALNPSMELLEGWRVHLRILLRSEWRRVSEYASLGGVQCKMVEENPVGRIIETVRTQYGAVCPQTLLPDNFVQSSL
jgi:Rsm1-like